MSHVRRDHPRCRDSTRICMCGHTREAVILVSSKSVQGVLNLYSAKNREDESEAHGVKICPFPLGLLWRLAFTAAQAVMYNNVEKNNEIYWRGISITTLCLWQINRRWSSAQSVVFHIHGFSFETTTHLLLGLDGSPGCQLLNVTSPV